METRFNQEEVNKIIEMYQNGIHIQEICNNLNSEEHEVRIILKDKQLDRHYNFFSNELSNRIIELHQMHYLHKDIRYFCLVSDNGINKILDRNNIPRMSYSERNQKYKRNSHYFDVIDTREKAYILGLIYADGNVFSPHNALTICLQAGDSDLLYQIKNALSYEGPLRFYDRKQPQHKDTCWLNINDEYMSKSLTKLGVMDNKSLQLKFPTKDIVPYEYINSFVLGYYDGDGSIIYSPKYNKCVTGIAGTFEFCNSLSIMLKELGIHNNIYHPKQSGDSNTYVIRTSANPSSLSFLRWMYDNATIKLERKYQYYLNTLDYINNRNKKVA